MKILFVANMYIEGGKPTSGFPAYLYRVSHALVEMGHTPIIIAGGEYDGHKFDNGIEIWRVKLNAAIYKQQWKTELIKYINLSYLLNKKIKEIVKKEKIDIIQFTSLAGCALLYHGKVPAVMRMSSYAKIAYAGFQTLDKKTVKVISAVERIAANNCDSIFAPSRITANALGKDLNKKVFVIETPFVNDSVKLDNRYIEKYLEGKKYVLFFGTLYAEKGILVIAEILEEFLSKNSEYYIVFVGKSCKINGKDARDIIYNSAKKYKNRIIVWGEIPHEQLYPIIINSDFVILPSLMENISNACIEAMYFSKIVIGTEGASFEQLIRDGKNGLLCKINDSKSLLDKMNKAVNLDNIEKRNIEINARRRIEQLKPEITVKKLLKYYDYVINKRIR